MKKIDSQDSLEMEAQAFRTFLIYKKEQMYKTSILMNLAGFCRNCLSKWYQKAGEQRGVSLNKEESREEIYGMPYQDWKEKYQK